MGYHDHDVFRFQLGATDDKGDLQTVSGRGHAGEELEGVHRVQHFGFHSNAPLGSHGIGLAPRGNRDLAVMLGIEHAGSRQRNTPVGSTAIYDANGGILSIVNKAFRVVGDSCTLVFGGSTFTFNGDGFAQTGGAQKHNDHDVGATHKHTGVMTGGGNTGAVV